jgi:hypothetical protein
VQAPPGFGCVWQRCLTSLGLTETGHWLYFAKATGTGQDAGTCSPARTDSASALSERYNRRLCGHGIMGRPTSGTFLLQRWRQRGCRDGRAVASDLLRFTATI